MLTLRPTAATQQDFSERLEAVRNMARPQPDLIEQVQRAILDGFAENFASESSASGKWAALAASTILDRLSQGYGPGPILERSGDYKSSWVDAGDGNHVHDVEESAGGWRMSEGSAHPLTAYHEEGTGTIPARPVAQLNDGNEERLREVVDNWILQRLLRR